MEEKELLQRKKKKVWTIEESEVGSGQKTAEQKGVTIGEELVFPPQVTMKLCKLL